MHLSQQMTSPISKHKQFFIGCLICLCVMPCLADWVKFSSSDKSVYYLNPAASKRVGNSVVILVLRDHTSPQYDRTQPYLSSKDEIEVDCAGRRIRRIYSSDHPLNMGEGKMIYSEHGPMSWNAAAPGTIVKRMVDIVCMRP
jgi:hypothetical protein